MRIALKCGEIWFNLYIQSKWATISERNTPPNHKLLAKFRVNI